MKKLKLVMLGSKESGTFTVDLYNWIRNFHMYREKSTSIYVVGYP